MTCTIDMQVLKDMIGTWRVGPIYALNGGSQSGKTTLALQWMCEYSHKSGRKGLLYDTEGGGDLFVDAWLPRHQKKYPKADVLSRTKRNWKKILLDHGIKLQETEISKGGKIKVTPAETLDDSPIAEYIKENDIGFILYDSLTMPMTAFGVNQENFPVRSSVQQMWMHSIFDIIDDHNVVAVMTNHVTSNPSQPWAKPTPVGGKAVQHNCKVQFTLKRWEAKGITDYRTLSLTRYYDVDKDIKKGHLKLTDAGYVDRTEQELDTDRANK